MRVENLLVDCARHFGANTAIIAGKARHSWGELDRKSEALAGALAPRVRPGEPVVVFMQNSWEAIVSLFGVLRAGAVLCPVGPSTESDRLAAIIAELAPVGVVTDARLASVAAAAMADAPSVRLVVLAGGCRTATTESCLRFEDAVAPAIPAPGRVREGGVLDPAMPAILFAGDGARLSHRVIVEAAMQPDRADPSWPHHFDGGLHQILTAARTGATLVLARSLLVAPCRAGDLILNPSSLVA